MKVFITVDGQERLLKGQELWSWDYAVREDDQEGPPDGIQVATFVPEMPKPAACVAPVVAMLQQKEAELQAETYAAVLELRRRQQEVLSITYEKVASDE